MYQLACAASDLDEGGVVWCEVAGRDLAVYRVQDEFFATDHNCSHGSASLSDGELNGYEIECPLHRGSFDIRTGAPVALPCVKPIRVYPVKVQEGDVLVALDGSE